jgi:phosphatidyl-myo-inositol dimannoside synthase
MRVLILATKFFGIGGAEGYTRMFAEAIAAEGAQVEVLSLVDGDAADRSCPGAYLGDGGSRLTRWGQVRFVAEALRRGRRWDLALCSHVAVAPVGLALSRLLRIPYVVLGYGIDVWGDVGGLRRAALQRAARVVALSHFTARMVATVQRVPRDRICVIHPAVDPVLLGQAVAHSPAPPDHNGVTLLTVARLSAEERYKGCDAVIAALPAVLAGGHVRYVIVGDGDDRPRLQALAEAQGVGPVVTFAGSVQRDGLAPWYRDCDIFVMPSVAEQRPDGWTGEGFGIVYLEAAAFGRPVIAGLGGGAPEAVQDGVTGYVVDGRDVNAVAATIMRLARDAPARERMGAAGRQWVHKHFTFERFRREAGAIVTAALSGAIP